MGDEEGGCGCGAGGLEGDEADEFKDPPLRGATCRGATGGGGGGADEADMGATDGSEDPPLHLIVAGVMLEAGGGLGGGGVGAAGLGTGVKEERTVLRQASVPKALMYSSWARWRVWTRVWPR